MSAAPALEWVQVDGEWVHVIRDLEQLRTLESWRLRWSEDHGAWLYFAPATDRAS